MLAGLWLVRPGLLRPGICKAVSALGATKKKSKNMAMGVLLAVIIND